MSDPVAAARALQPRIREAAAAIERERKLPAALVREFLDAGLFHMLIPRSLGGPEIDPITAARVVQEVATADGSAGWCVMIAAQNATFAGMLPAKDAEEIWSNGGIAAGTARPTGRAVWTHEPADGYIVSGRWPFASGSSHATWLMGECIVYDGESPRKNAQGDDVTRALFVPRRDVTIHDTWDTMGLRGTASNDFSVENVFVPESRGFQMIVDPPVHPGALYTALPLVFMNHGSHALGVAHGALDAATEIISTRRGWGNQPLREQPRMQLTIAEATALVESAERYLYDAAAELWEAATGGVEDTARLRARVRLAASHATRASVQAVDLVHGAVATSAIFTGSPLERQFRDIHTAAAHVMIGPLTYQAAGRVQLGLGPDFPFF
ncbi:MAG: indole-3-acetate monooxygenase [Chloroflexota bacterium]|nr:indole-3-acetate monooxygenase [Chloroflexota bacterium]